MFQRKKGSSGSFGRRRARRDSVEDDMAIEMTDVSTWRNPPQPMGGGGNGQQQAQAPPPSIVAPRPVAPAPPQHTAEEERDLVDIGRQFAHPLFPQRHVRVRQSDETSGLEKVKHMAKEAVQDKREEVAEGIQDFREKSTGGKVKTVASKVGRFLAGKIPFGSAVVNAGDAANSHMQMQEASEVAQADDTSHVMGQLAQGESTYYKKQRNRQAISTGTSAVSSAVGLATAGTLASVANTVGTAGANLIGSKISDRLVDGETNLPELRRQMARHNWTPQHEVDKGTTGLQLAQQNPDAAHAMLKHLNRRALTPQEEFELNVKDQEKWRPTSLKKGESGVERQHTLLPSQVQRVGQAETSRMRLQQKEKVKLDSLQKTRESSLLSRGVEAVRNRVANRVGEQQAIPLQPMAPLAQNNSPAPAAADPQAALQARLDRLRQPIAQPAAPAAAADPQAALQARLDRLRQPIAQPAAPAAAADPQAALQARLDRLREDPFETEMRERLERLREDPFETEMRERLERLREDPFETEMRERLERLREDPFETEMRERLERLRGDGGSNRERRAPNREAALLA